MGFFIIKLVLPNYKENQPTKLSFILTIPTTLKSIVNRLLVLVMTSYTEKFKTFKK